MPITELLERNAREFPKDIALVEINPEIQEKRRVTWRDYELIQPDARHHYRRDITWHVFNEKELLIFLLAEVLEKEIKLQFF
jgi:hypothetical protein